MPTPHPSSRGSTHSGHLSFELTNLSDPHPTERCSGNHLERVSEELSVSSGLMVSFGVVPGRSKGALTSSSSKLGHREGRLPLCCTFGPPFLSAHSPGGGKEKSRDGTFRRSEDKAVDILPWPWMNTQQEHSPPACSPASFLVHLPAPGCLNVCPVA